MQKLLPIELLDNGQHARVVEIDGDRHTVMRLHEMGLRPGSHVRMVRCGTPCIIAVEDRRFSFRGDQAACVLVETG